MPTTLTLAQVATAHARFVDALGQPAAVDGDVVWQTADPAVVSFENPTPRNLDLDLVPHAMGEADVQALGWSTDPAVGRITLSLHVTVVAAPAVGGAIVVDAPRAR